MELNKNSKWLKFYLNFNSNRPTNFCDYFWGSLKAIAILLFILSFTLVLSTCLISPIMLFWESFDETSDISFFQIMGITFWFAGIVGYITYIILDYYENKDYKPHKEYLIKTWYKDFKNKHCTLITWK